MQKLIYAFFFLFTLSTWISSPVFCSLYFPEHFRWESHSSTSTLVLFFLNDFIVVDSSMGCAQCTSSAWLTVYMFESSLSFILPLPILFFFLPLVKSTWSYFFPLSFLFILFSPYCPPPTFSTNTVAHSTLLVLPLCMYVLGAWQPVKVCCCSSSSSPSWLRLVLWCQQPRAA